MDEEGGQGYFLGWILEVDLGRSLGREWSGKVGIKGLVVGCKRGVWVLDKLKILLNNFKLENSISLSIFKRIFIFFFIDGM